MGQQQLLLLVLSTVIVGLATVAGIQAFSESQAQASQDALVQRGTQIASDLLAADGKPDQMGGIDLTASNPTVDDWANAIGLSSATGIDAGGAGDGATCDIENGTGDATENDFNNITPDATVDCAHDGADVEIGIQPGASPDQTETVIVSTASV
jgi:hypothetical protein